MIGAYLAPTVALTFNGVLLSRALSLTYSSGPLIWPNAAFGTNRAFIWVLEAARNLCGGGADDLAVKLLEMPLTEIKRESELTRA